MPPYKGRSVSWEFKGKKWFINSSIVEVYLQTVKGFGHKLDMVSNVQVCYFLICLWLKYVFKGVFKFGLIFYVNKTVQLKLNIMARAKKNEKSSGSEKKSSKQSSNKNSKNEDKE